MNLALTSFHLMLIICSASLFACVIFGISLQFIVYVLKCNANEFVASYLRLMSQVTYLIQVKVQVQVQLPELPVQPQVQVVTIGFRAQTGKLNLRGRHNNNWGK